MDDRQYDYVIVGGGSAGCVLANRLSADPRNRVALIEAGGKDDWIWFHIPVGYLFAIGNPRADWMLRTEQIPGLGGRSLAYPRGKVLGGSSAINAMIYMRGQSQDYDGWRDMGLPGWGWDDVLPVFRQHEDSWRSSSVFHAKGGEWRVERPRLRWEILDAIASAAAEVGIPPTDDFNTGDNEGSGYFDVNQRLGRRWSSARGFLRPIQGRKNLDVLTHLTVDRVVVEQGRAVGVVARGAGDPFIVRARGEVILTAGAVASPAILERSGIGGGALLQSLGIASIRDLPGVGENLQDHLQVRPIFRVANVPTMNMLYRSWLQRARMGAEYALLRRGALTMAPSQLGLFTRSAPHHSRPNIQLHVQPLSLDKFGEPMHDFPAVTVSVCNLRPTSRGSVHVRSLGAADAPAIAPNYLATEQDRQVAVEALRRVRAIMGGAALQRYNPSEFRPGASIQGDAELAASAAENSTTIFHPVGTARMGVAGDPLAVVDGQLRVFGMDGLRVADASVMPSITSGNTNSPTIMIAEKAAAAILARR